MPGQLPANIRDLEVQSAASIPGQYLFDCIDWTPNKDELTLRACIPYARFNDFFESEKERCGADATLQHYRTRDSSANTRDYIKCESTEWHCSAQARCEKAHKKKVEDGQLNASRKLTLGNRKPMPAQGQRNPAQINCNMLRHACGEFVKTLVPFSCAGRLVCCPFPLESSFTWLLCHSVG